MISFEMEDKPNAQTVTNDQFKAIYEIAALDWSRNYVVTEAQETGGDWFLIVEKELDGDCVTQTFYRVEFDGDWGVLYEVKQPRPEPVTEHQWKQEFAEHEGDLLPAKRPVIVYWDDPFETPSEAIERVNKEYLEAGPTPKLVENVKRIRAELPKNGTVDESEVYYSDNHHRAMILLPGEKHVRKQLLIYVTDVGDGEAVSAYVKSWGDGIRETEID